MGLTGVILDATVRLLPHRDQPVLGRHRPASPDLDTLLALMDEGDRRLPLLGGLDRPHGQGLAPRAQRADPGRPRPTRPAGASRRRRPAGLRPAPAGRACRRSSRPAGVLNHATVAAFNELWYRKAPRRRVGQIVSHLVASSTRSTSSASGTACTAGAGSCSTSSSCRSAQETALRTVVERLAGSGTASFLAVLKRFGAANPARSASRSRAGRWRSTCRRRSRGLAGLLHGLDERRARRRRSPLPRQGLRTRRPTPSAAGYPRLDEWQAVRASVDPAGVWASDQSRRLRLLDD